MNWKRSTLIGMLGLATIAYSERSGISAFTAWMDAGFWAKKAEDAAISAAKGTELVDQAVVFHTGLEHLPASFRNTEPDGALRADSEGNLVIDRSVRRLFDYFLAGYGEESSAVLEARIRAYIRSHLTEPARSQANLLLDDYLALQAQLARLDNSSDRPEMDVASLSAALERKDTLKRAYLSSEAVDAFYGEEESYDRFWIEKVKIMQHPQLTEVEKAQKIAEIELLLPDTLRRAMEQSQLANKLQEQTQQLLDKGGSAAELQQLRESSVGVAAAERLSALDSQRAQWQARVDTWFKQKDEIMQNRNLAETDKAQLLAELRGQYFNEAELRRVQALERIRDGAKSSFAAMPE